MKAFRVNKTTMMRKACLSTIRNHVLLAARYTLKRISASNQPQPTVLLDCTTCVKSWFARNKLDFCPGRKSIVEIFTFWQLQEHCFTFLEIPAALDAVSRSALCKWLLMNRVSEKCVFKESYRPTSYRVGAYEQLLPVFAVPSIAWKKWLLFRSLPNFFI